jgi:hypothetical protein
MGNNQQSAHAHFEIMKRPNRNFVVEYKGARKRGMSQPQSIWGDTDLHSAAKSVEADGLLPMDTSPMPSADAFAAGEPTATEATETFVSVEQTAEDRFSVPPQVHGLQQPPADKITTPPRKARGNDFKPRRRRAQVAAITDAPSHPESYVAWEDELAQLDAENRRLKRELSEKLRAENEALVAMLQRVNVTG